MYSITKNYDGFKDLQFVLKAKSKDTTKLSFCVLWVIDFKGEKHFMCSDSRRIHMAICDMDIETGAYDVIQTQKEIILKPSQDDPVLFNYEHVIPKKEKMTHIMETINLKEKYISQSFELSKAAAKITLRLINSCINIDYLKDVMMDKFDVYMSEQDTYSPLLFLNETKQAIVMPITINV